MRTSAPNPDAASSNQGLTLHVPEPAVRLSGARIKRAWSSCWQLLLAQWVCNALRPVCSQSDVQPILSPPFAPVPCWWTPTSVPSIITYSKSGSSQRALKTRARIRRRRLSPVPADSETARRSRTDTISRSSLFFGWQRQARRGCYERRRRTELDGCDDMMMVPAGIEVLVASKRTEFREVPTVRSRCSASSSSMIR